MGRLIHLFGHHVRHEFAIGKRFEEGVIRDFVQFLHDFALHIDLVLGPERVGQPGHPQASGDALGGQRNLGQENGEFSGCTRVLLLLHENMTG